MKANTSQEKHLRREIRWTKEALSIAENCSTHHSIQEIHKEQIPCEFRHLADVAGNTTELKNHIERLHLDLVQFQSGEWDTEGGQKHE